MFRFPPRRILVPVDLSETSLRAFRAAKFVAERFRARLEAVYCEPPPSSMGHYDDFPADRERRRRVAAQLRRRFKGAHSLHVVRGEPDRVILRLARDRAANLIVMGTHARVGLLRALMGSVAEAVVRGSSVPVLIVRKTLRPLRRVLAPIREDKDARRGLVAAAVVARAFKARLDVLHVSTDSILGASPEKLLRTRLGELAASVIRDTQPSMEIRNGNPQKQILRATRGRDLLVLVSRPKSLLGDWVLGTTAERLIRHSPIPVLTIPAPRRGKT